MKATAHWRWDARIVGMGATPEEDTHLTVVEGLAVPGRLLLAFPVAEAYAGLSGYGRELAGDGEPNVPILHATRIEVDIALEPAA